MKWRKWNRIIHRDLGFFFLGMTLIYAISGIAINHIGDWNPNYIVKTNTYTVTAPQTYKKASKAQIETLLDELGENGAYKKHIYPTQSQMKIFIKNGSVVMDLQTGKTVAETIKKRPVFNQLNYLHYNPGKGWKWFSDFFAISLILIAISGILITRGKKGLKGSGGIYLLLGIIVPLLFIFWL